MDIFWETAQETYDSVKKRVGRCAAKANAASGLAECKIEKERLLRRMGNLLYESYKNGETIPPSLAEKCFELSKIENEARNYLEKMRS